MWSAAQGIIRSDRREFWQQRHTLLSIIDLGERPASIEDLRVGLESAMRRRGGRSPLLTRLTVALGSFRTSDSFFQVW